MFQVKKVEEGRLACSRFSQDANFYRNGCQTFSYVRFLNNVKEETIGLDPDHFFIFFYKNHFSSIFFYGTVPEGTYRQSMVSPVLVPNVE